MGRPLKRGLHYFNIDCDQEDNLNYIEARHGLTGYGVIVKLWRKIYMINGYYTEWNEKNIYLFAREINVEVDLINKIVESCFDEGIFKRELFNKFQILTSKGIQRRYIKIVTEAKRKDNEIEEKFNLLEFPPENKAFPPEETKETPEESTQTKQKETKQKESKESTPKGVEETKVSPPDNPPDFGNVEKNKVAIGDFIKKHKPTFIEPYAELWNLFAQERSLAKISKITNGRKAKFKTRIHESAFDFLAILKKASQSEFLLTNKWFGFDWIFENEKNYLKIIEGSYDKKNEPGAVKSKPTPLPAVDLQYLFERFCEDELDTRLLTPKHYEDLNKKNLVHIDHRIIQQRMNALIGSNKNADYLLYEDYQKELSTKLTEEDKPVLMRIAVIEYFKKLKKEKLATAH